MSYICGSKVIIKQKNKVMEEKVPAGYAEIVDTLNDGLDIAEGIAEVLKDGFQVYDLATLLQVYPKAQEIYTDRLRFKAEFLDLDADETRAIYEDLAKLRGENPIWIEAKALAALDFVSEGYELYEKGKMLFLKGRALVAGKAA